MRACPNVVKCPGCGREIPCGHVDPPYWRQVPWKFEVDMCWTDDFKRLNPEQYKRLMKGHKFAFDECFAYRFSGKARKIVWRVWIKLYEAGGKSAFNIPMEACLHKRDPFQQKFPKPRKQK